MIAFIFASNWLRVREFFGPIMEDIDHSEEKNAIQDHFQFNSHLKIVLKGIELAKNSVDETTWQKFSQQNFSKINSNFPNKVTTYNLFMEHHSHKTKKIITKLICSFRKTIIAFVHKKIIMSSKN